MTKITFEPKRLNLEELFKETNSLYQIPEYQRPYSWDRKRVEQLWEDLVEAYQYGADNNDLDHFYFLGSMVVCKGKGNNVYGVIDGQQRLTTLTILFCVLRDLNLPMLEDYQDDFKKCILYSSRGKDEFRLRTLSKDQTLFEKEILNGIDFEKIKQEPKSSRFLQTAYYFKGLIEDSLKEKINNEPNELYVESFNEFVDYLFDKVYLICTECNDQNSAVRLFSVLNDRGMGLTSADLMKAYWLPSDEKDREAFISTWDSIETIFKPIKENIEIEEILNLYFYSISGKNPRLSLHEELQKEEKLKNRNPKEIIQEIKDFSAYLAEMMLNYEDKDISKLKYLPYGVYWKSILLTAKTTDYDYYDELKKLLVKYYYQSWIAGGTAGRIKQTSFNIIKAVKEKQQIDSIKQMMLANLRNYARYEEALTRKNVYEFKWHKPLLLAIEYAQRDHYPFVEWDRNLHTEHILPKEWQSKGLNWSDIFDKDTTEAYLNCLGNLTLLSGAKNIKASNRNYLDKQEIYKGGGLDGKTSFEITQKVFEDDPMKWNKESIEKRQEWLIGEAKKLFEID